MPVIPTFRKLSSSRSFQATQGVQGYSSPLGEFRARLGQVKEPVPSPNPKKQQQLNIKLMNKNNTNRTKNPRPGDQYFSLSSTPKEFFYSGPSG